MATGEDTIESLSAKPLDPRGTTLLSIITSLGSVLAACSCCILPMALAGLGVSASFGGALSPLGPLRWPMMAFAAVAVAASWLVVVRRRHTCLCAPRDTLIWLVSPRMLPLIIATKFTALAAGWSFIEPILMKVLV